MGPPRNCSPGRACAHMGAALCTWMRTGLMLGEAVRGTCCRRGLPAMQRWRMGVMRAASRRSAKSRPEFYRRKAKLSDVLASIRYVLDGIC